MAEEKVLAIGKVFGTPGEEVFSILVGAIKETVDGVSKVVGAKYQLNIPELPMADFPPEAQEAFFNAGRRAILGNRKAADFRASTDYGTEADALAFVEKYSTVEGQVSALAREKKAPVEKLDDAATLAVKMLVNAQVKRVLEGTEVTKEMRAEFKKLALVWKAEGNKNWAAAFKKAEAVTGLELA